MKEFLRTIFVAVCLAAFSVPGMGSEHGTVSLTHAEAAVKSAQEGDLAAVKSHAQAAVEHARSAKLAAQSEKHHHHLGQAIESLDEAIAAANKGDQAQARQSAEEAVQLLKQHLEQQGR